MEDEVKPERADENFYAVVVKEECGCLTINFYDGQFYMGTAIDAEDLEREPRLYKWALDDLTSRFFYPGWMPRAQE